DNTIGTDPGVNKNPAAAGNWGGLVFRQDSDRVFRTQTQDYDDPNQPAGIFLNYVNHAQITFGGGQVVVNSQPQVFDPIHLISARPTISFNTITKSADAAMSADPTSFQETEFQGPTFDSDYSRVGPSIHGNTLANDSINGLFVRIRTDPNSSQVLDPLTVSARFTATDIVYVVEENLVVQGSPGGFFLDLNGQLHDRQSARLAIDPGVIVKLNSARIETQIGAQFIAEGTAAKPIVFTSVFDDTFGAGGTFDTTNDANFVSPFEGAWGGLYFGPLSIGSVDHALVQYGGGRTTIEGGFDNFDAVEIHQAQVRIANSTLQKNGPGGGGDRNGRGTATQAVIFVVGAQPAILNNVIQNNDTAPITDPNAPFKNTAAISINVNSLNSTLVNDWGRSTGNVDLAGQFNANTGPLIRGNKLTNTPINGMIVRGGEITTNVVWDDTDIVHVLEDQVIASNAHSTSGTIRLQSTATESLVVKLLGVNAGFTANGQPLDITDRIGGTLQVVGLPNHPVVMTSLFDDTVGAGFTPGGELQKDTHNTKGVTTGPALFPNSGPIFLDGGDRDDHGSFSNGKNNDGWKFIQQALNFALTNSKNTIPGADGILVIGVHQGTGTPTQAEDAIVHAAGALNPAPNLTFVTGADILNADFSKFKMIYVPSDDVQNFTDPVTGQVFGFDTVGGITDEDLAFLTQRKFDTGSLIGLQTFVDVTGGGLVALTEDAATNPYTWLALPDPFTIQSRFGINLTQTPALAAAGFNITDKELSAGTPWHNNWVGPPGFNRLRPWVVDPANGEVVTLGSGPGDGGIGTRLAIPQPGDWAGLTLDTLSNDTNVEVVNEIEQGFSAAGDTNSLPTIAQFLGILAKDSKSGDDNSRLGFDVRGTISQTKSSPGFGDVDVYSFQATAGSTVWLDIDRTASALDSVVELIDANGSVIARSNDSLREQQNPALLVGDPSIVKPLAQGFTQSPNFTGTPSPFSNPDFFSTNPFDAGMRVDLPPGPSGPVSTYFVRVRANNGPSGTNTNLASNSGVGPNQGLTKGAYELVVRLQNLDQVPGSTVRNADIRYAATGIQVIGKPEHSPLLGDTAETSLDHSTLETAQDLGNLAGTDRAQISVAANLATATSVDWFKFNLNYNLIDEFGPQFALKTLGAMFSVNYADGLNRPDTTISLFDENGNLILVGRDSNTPDGQPRPGTGADLANLSHGSFGALDPSIGPVQLPADSQVPAPAGSFRVPRTYYVAISSSAVLPAVLDATFTPGPTPSNPNRPSPTDEAVRLEPINSIARLVDDRIGSTGDTTAAGSRQIFPGSAPQQLNLSANPLQLGDIPLFVNTLSSLGIVNGFTGASETTVATNLPDGITDIAFRDDGRLASTTTTDPAGNQFSELSPADGSFIYQTPIGVQTFDVDTMAPITAGRPPRWNYGAPAGNSGVTFQALAYENPLIGTSAVSGAVSGPVPRELFAVGSRSEGNQITEAKNILFQLDPSTGTGLAKDYQRAHPGGNQTYQPFSDSPASSGTDLIPRGQILTGATILLMPATDPTNPANDIISGTTTMTIVAAVDTKKLTFFSGPEIKISAAGGAAFVRPAGQPHLTITLNKSNSILFPQGYVFEFTPDGSLNNGTHIPIIFNPTTDTASQIATKIATAVNSRAGDYQKPAGANGPNDPSLRAGAGRDRVTFLGADSAVTDFSQLFNAGAIAALPLGTSFTAPPNPIFFGAGDDATALGNDIKQGIFDAHIVVKVGDPTTLPFPTPDTIVTSTVQGTHLVVKDGKPTVDAPLSTDVVAGRSGDINGIAILPSPNNQEMFAVSDSGGLYQVQNLNQDDAAVSTLIALIKDKSGKPINFTGLTVGPPDVEGGKFKQVLFGIDQNGVIYAIDHNNANLLPIFLNGETSIATGVGGAQGLSFSPIDYNLWHVTTTRKDDPGHGLTNSFDFDANRNPLANNDVFRRGGNSFSFGLDNLSGNYQQQPNAGFFDKPDRDGNQSLINTYNVPGGAYGSLTSGTFDLTGYTATDKPTVYFDYMLDTQDATSTKTDRTTMRDSFRVFASTDGGRWTQLATNNSLKSDTDTTDAELPAFASVSGGTYMGFGTLSNQNVQQLFNVPGTASQPQIWRQARIDLGDFAGLSNIRLRFDFSSSGSLGTGSPLLGGSYLAAAAGSKLKGGQSFALTDPNTPGINYRFTFRSGLVLLAPAGAGGAIQSGETFTINGGNPFEFTSTGGLPPGDTNFPVFISSASTAEDVARAVGNALAVHPVAGVTPIVVGARVQLLGAATVNAGPMILEGAQALPAPLLQAPVNAGTAIKSGETFTINSNGTSETFEFTTNASAILSTGLLANGHVAILTNTTLLPQDVATAIVNALSAHPVIGVTPVLEGANVQLLGATSVTQSASPALVLQGPAQSPALARTDVPFALDMTPAQVATQVAAALDREFSFVDGGTDDPTIFTSSKVDGNLLHIYGRSVADAGPLASQSQLPGEEFGNFTNAQRGTDNSHEGVYIDDIVVGFAGRGEMVSNSAIKFDPTTGQPIGILSPLEQLNTDLSPSTPPAITGFHTFFSLPSDPNSIAPTKILAGDYELNIRRATPYASSTSLVFPFIDLNQTGDINDRLASGITLLALPASQIPDDSTFSILTENALPVTHFPNVLGVPGVTTFQFVRAGESPPNDNTNIRVLINTDDDAAAVATKIRDAINNVAPSVNFVVKAGLGTLSNPLTGARVNLFGALDVNPGPLGTAGTTFYANRINVFKNYGDTIPIQDQGETIIQSNRISNTLRAGIAVKPVEGTTGEGATIGVPGRTGAVVNLPTLNTTSVIPGTA
ncbi:MAG: pre-peptidase C-terminal domain-containing protein, partial [Planctomycetia bacterium]|nr:pre-peptidase C-terminal domain-containing protein [Planctomycetia bacterium]